MMTQCGGGNEGDDSVWMWSVCEVMRVMTQCGGGL